METMSAGPTTEAELREQMAELGRRLHQQGFVAATDGNLSVRLENGNIMTTPTNMSKGMCCAADMIVVDRAGKKVSGQRNASTELAMHLLIYNLRPDVNGIVHAHPPTATGFAAAGMSLNKALISEVVLSLGSVPLARYGTPGTSELSDALRDLVPHFDAILMANHGVVTFGEDLIKAYFHMETVEHFARISLVTEMLGKQVLLSRQDVQKLLEARSRYYGSAGGAIHTCEPLAADSETHALSRFSLLQEDFRKFLEDTIRKLKMWPA